MRVLIVEDEAVAARRLERLVAAALGPKLCDIAIAETVTAGRLAIAARRIDLVLLDLDLNGADGFEIIRGAPDAPRTIVVSARTDRAIDAFDNAVIDFVSKPVTEGRLARALDRALKAPAAVGEMSLAVRSGGRIQLAPFSRIVALSGADDYVDVTLIDGRKALHDARLDDLEKRLPSQFRRVHRSHIVNLVHVQEVRTLPAGRRSLILPGAQIPVSRRRAAKILAALGV